MDTLTHGLLGAAVGAIPLPRRLGGDGDPVRAARAGVLAGVLAAQLPDVDYLLPAADSVLHTLQAHRGLTHALVAVPVVALVAAALAKLLFRSARFAPLYLRALLAVPLAHLLPDLWTGWGTRLLLPFSDARLALDWTMVLDPLFTAPLLVAAGWALWRRARWRRALAMGAALAALYLGLRVASAHHLTAVVRAGYPDALRVRVFPAPLGLARWRYVAVFPGEYAVGSVALGGPREQQARAPALPTGPLPADLAAVPTVREALAWARFPVVRVADAGPLGRRVEIADLRYHLRGQPTLKFVVTVTRDGTVTEARLDRGGTAGQLLRRFRGRDGR
jgi:inner membrane protein